MEVTMVVKIYHYIVGNKFWKLDEWKKLFSV
jgi:hypothetical protein